MLKRLSAFLLWTYALWYAGAFLESLGILSGPLGLAAGLLIGAGVALDPTGGIWGREHRSTLTGRSRHRRPQRHTGLATPNR
jgi:hypothetical protein